MEKYSFHGHQKSRDQLSWKLWRLLLNFVFWAIVDICFENSLPNLINSILIVWSSIFWQLWNFFYQNSGFHGNLNITFHLFWNKRLQTFPTLHEEKQKDSWSCQMYFRIWVTMVTRSVVMETEVTLDWFLQIFPDLEIFAHLKMFLIYYYVF